MHKVEQMDNTGYLLSLSSTGALWCSCSDTCTAMLIASSELDQVPMIAKIESLPLPPWDCLHCGWCGQLVYQPAECAWHGTDCPAASALEHRHPESSPFNK